MKKLGNYYGQVARKYGVVLPLIVVAALFALACLFEVNDLFNALKKASEGVFYTLFIVALVAFVIAIAYVFIKGKSEEVCVLDACLTWGAVLFIACLVLFCCNISASWFSVAKIVVASVGILVAIIAAALRTKYVDCE